MSALPAGTVTFLFSDIQGSTELLKVLGRDEYGNVLSIHNELLRQAFHVAGGEEIDRQGDSFFAVFRSAGAAVQGAIAGQQALARQEWPERTVVRVRMGIHTGEATLGEDGYVGFAVHQASRIGDAGHGGQILLSSTTARLVEHDLPRDVSLRDSFPPLTTRAPTGVSTGGPVLLEREAELAALRAMIEVGRGGNGRFVAIEGNAAIGKTRLVGETRSLAASAGMRVLTARGGEREHEFSFGIVRQLFEPVLALASTDEREELLTGAAALAAPLFDERGLSDPEALADNSFATLHRAEVAPEGRPRDGRPGRPQPRVPAPLHPGGRAGLGDGVRRETEDEMQKWLYLTVLALALLTLAVGRWVVKGITSATKSAGRLAPRPA